MKITPIALASLVLGAGTAAGLASPSGAASANANKTSICHRTHSEKNPFVLIIVDDSAVPAHMREHGDDAMPRNGLCPPTSAGWPDNGDGGDGGGEF